MRRALIDALLFYREKENFFFLTGDLGYKALEQLELQLGNRFINAGIAEQNMISVAAGIALEGGRPWCYSIAPFMYARPFEQIKNDVCSMQTPVMLVGNGGGFAYGVMGPSHHAIADYGALLTLDKMYCYIPVFDSDISAIVAFMMQRTTAAYLRLGISEEPKDFIVPAYQAWRRLIQKEKAPVVVVVGSIAGSYIEVLKDLCNLWVVSELPILELPLDFLSDLTNTEYVLIVEEHVNQGSFGVGFLALMAQLCVAAKIYVHACVLGYASGLHGSKEFHRKENNLDPDSISGLVKRMVHADSKSRSLSSGS
jgi:transketolase